MKLSPETKLFIREHFNDNTDKLLLSAGRYPSVDVPFAVAQIIARRQIQDKVPEWYSHEDIIYPSRLSTEQCSSELTARYKQKLLRGTTVCDLTGGLGIDTYYLSREAASATYIERYPEYCAAAEHNFSILGAPCIRVVHADLREIIHTLQAATFYIDPARRAECNKRVFALPDCEPDLLQLKPVLLENAQRVIVKISPMADIGETLRLLPETSEVHILAVKNECKELLFVLEGPYPRKQDGEVIIHAVNLLSASDFQEFIFREEEEKQAGLITTSYPEQYLYEPHAALMKSGAFKLTASRHGVKKLHRHSHLYTSADFCTDFPGRSFKIDTTYPFSGKLLKQLSQKMTKANITIRNFPLTVAELRHRSNIKEGGDIYLFATTLDNEQKVIIQSHKV